jgi:hypothetical protein
MGFKLYPFLFRAPRSSGLFLSVLLLSLLIASCGGGGGGSSPGGGLVVSRIEVQPASVSVSVNQQQQFGAIAFDQKDNKISGATFTWTSGNPVIATVDANGLATASAIQAGSVNITASIGNVSDTAILTVTQNPPPDGQDFLPTGFTPIGVVTTDIDGDLDQDVVVANFDSSNLLIYLGDGEGNLGSGTPPQGIPLITGSQPVAVVAADFDKDLRIDLVSLNLGDPTLPTPEPPSLTVFLQTAPFSFNPSTVSLEQGTSPVQVPFGMATGDINGDGNVDLVITDIASGTVLVLLGVGDGTFATLQQPTSSDICTPSAVVAGKFRGAAPNDNDDVAVVCPADDSLIVLIGQFFNQIFTEFQPFTHPTGNQPVALTVADIGGGPGLDLVVVNKGGESLSIFDGDGNGGFSLSTTVPLGQGTQPVAIATGDFDGVNGVDLAVANSGNDTVTILFGDGAGGFSNPLTNPTGQTPSAIAVADLNGNATPDLLVTTSGDNRLYVYLDPQ